MNVALLLSGGTGTRLGNDTPKQYIEVNGRPIVSYCMQNILEHRQIHALQIVADSQWHVFLENLLDQYDTSKIFKGFSNPGENRQMSILHGLQDISLYAEASDTVFIHDAARPVLSDAQITECVTKIKGHDGVIPVLPMKDTIYMSADGVGITSLLNRSRIFAGQAPESFVLGKYLAANQELLPDKILRINGSTEPAVMAGMDIVMIPGDENNFKITTSADLERFEKESQTKADEMRY